MSIDYSSAYDEVMGHFKTNFDISYDNFLGFIPVEYPNIETGIVLTNHNAWIRVSEKIFSASQKSLGQVGNRIFNRIGLITIQIFTKADTNGMANIKKLGELVTNIFEGKQTSTGNILFDNVSYREIGISERWFQANVTSYYEYYVTK